MITTKTFICQLHQSTQNDVVELVNEYLEKNNISGNKAEEIRKNVMDGRICDIEDDIDLNKLFVFTEHGLIERK